MPSSPAVESFWNQLAQSGLLPIAQVKALSHSLSEVDTASDASVARKLVELGHLTRYQADRLLEGRSRGFFFDQYKLLDLVGVGGMGWVYRAINPETNEIFALKVLLERFKNDRGMVVRFEQEAKAGMLLNHENIVRTFGYGVAGGLPYVVMEYVEGPSLLELLRLRERSRLPWEQACDIARQAALGLQCVHGAGLIHRDIKPQNLLIEKSGKVKLLDFGLTMLHEGETGDEFSMAMIFGHECVGTAAFMAPEQAIDSLKSDARSDVYGLGCTLFAILTGDTPFPFPDTKDVLKGHASMIPKNVCDIVAGIPRPVGDIIAKMLAKDPNDRHATAEEVATALSVWSKTKPIDFDFDKILADRNKIARQKLAEFQKRQKSSVNASNSTAKPAGTSSVTSNSSTRAMRSVGIDPRSPAASSSIVRKDPFGFEHPPPIVIRKRSDPAVSTVTHSIDAIKSEMVLLPLNGDPPIPLTKSRFVIGRGNGCDLQVQDQSVSSRHCELRFDGEDWTLVDLNSRNGVRVNGEPIQSKSLEPGDTIIIGSSFRIRFSTLRGRAILASKRNIAIVAAMALIAIVLLVMFKVF